MKPPAVALLAVLLSGAMSPDSPVADAAMTGDLAAVRALLSDGADVNAPQGDGMTALHWAARSANADLARLLIGSPRLVLLDEPDAGLDQDAAPIIDHLIRKTTTRGGAVLCVSHDADKLSGWVDRVVEMRDGRIM